MKPLRLSKQFDCIKDLGYKNLVASGCSFTYNNHASASVTWPLYLRDLGGFSQVTDLALPGAGNRHISSSTQWYLENSNLDCNDTLIIVMWSGNDRDDDIISHEHINDYPMRFYYDSTVVTAMSTGAAKQNVGNVSEEYWRLKQQYKTHQSRAIENYLYISGLYHYLKSNQYKFLFLNYLDREVPSRTVDFDIGKHLPDQLKTRLDCMVNTKVENIYKWCIQRDLLDSDDFHPSPDGHLAWTRQVLLPFLSSYKP